MDAGIKTADVSFTEEAYDKIVERGIRAEDCVEAIAMIETCGKFLMKENDSRAVLSRMRLGNYCLYVRYDLLPSGSYEVKSAYSHRLKLNSEDSEGAFPENPVIDTKSIWVCNTCQVNVDRVEDIVLRYEDFYSPPGKGFRCPKCGFELLSESQVMGELYAAELMLEAK